MRPMLRAMLASPTCPPNGPSNTKFSAFPSNSAARNALTGAAASDLVFAVSANALSHTGEDRGRRHSSKAVEHHCNSLA